MKRKRYTNGHSVQTPAEDNFLPTPRSAAAMTRPGRRPRPIPIRAVA
jgi:hypothetical protein